jgi:hypothetical protein
MQTIHLLLFGLMPLSMVIIVMVYVRSRRREGVRPFEITPADKAQFRKAKEDYTPGKIVAQFLAGIGSLFLLVTIYPAGEPMSWSDRFACLVAGVVLIGVAVWMAKPRNRPRYWWAVIWGMVCGVCWVVTLTSMIITRYTPVSPGHPLPAWLKSMMGLGVIVGCPAAILRLIYGAGTFINPGEEKKNENPGTGESVR